MGVALVKLGSMTSGAGTTSDSPTFGQATTAGNLLVAWAVSFGTANAIATSASGWSQASQVSNANGSSAIFYKPNCGASETAPTFTCTSGTKMFSMLGEYTGAVLAAPVGPTGTATGTASPLSITAGAADATPGALMLTAVRWTLSTATSPTYGDTYNNATATSFNPGTKDTQLCDFAYGITTSSASADNDSSTNSSTKISNCSGALASFIPVWSQVQTLAPATSNNNGIATLTITASFGSNVTAGNRILLFVSNATVAVSSPPDINTPTSTPSLTWTRLVHNSQIDTTVPVSTFGSMWTAVVATTGSLQISVSFNTGTNQFMAWSAGEYGGLDASAGSGCVDVSALGTPHTQSGGATTSVSTGTTAATHGANQLAIAQYVDAGYSNTITVASGFALQAGLTDNASANATLLVGTKNSASGATEGGNFTYSSNAQVDLAFVAVLKLPSAGPPSAIFGLPFGSIGESQMNQLLGY